MEDAAGGLSRPSVPQPVRAISRRSRPSPCGCPATRSTRRATVPARLRGHQQHGADVLHRQAAGLQDPRQRVRRDESLAAGRLSARQAGAGCRENVIFLCLPGITAAACCSPLRTAAWPASASVPTPPPPTAASSPAPTAKSSRWYRSCPLTEDRELALLTNEPRALLVHTALLAPKTTRGTQGVQVMNIKPKYHLERLADVADTGITNQARYRTRTIPPPAPCCGRRTVRKKQLELL